MQLRSFCGVPDHVVKAETIRTHSECNLPIARAIEALAEAQARKLHLADGYATMREFCECELNLSDDEAAKRLQVAAAVRDCPAILPMLADGRLHQTAVVMLAPHLKKCPDAVALLTAAARKSKSQIALLIAERFPRPDVPTSVQPMDACGVAVAVASGGGEVFVMEAPTESAVLPSSTRTPVPTSPGRFAVQFTLDEEARRELEYARALNRRVAPCGDMAEFYRWAVQQAIKLGEKRAFGGRNCRRRRKRPATTEPNGRHIPDALREQVWIRDEGRCTFVSASGRRCSAEGTLDIDHKVPVGKGGQTELENLRLLCPAHNQFEAERAFGAGFMAEKRAHAREQSATAGADVSTPSETQVPEPEFSTVPEQVDWKPEAAPHWPDHTALLAQREDIVSALRALHFKPADARRAATWCDHLLGQSLETCVKYALQQLVMPRFKRGVVRPHGNVNNSSV